MESAPEEKHVFASFEEFWPFYVSEHQNKTTRTIHFIGTSAAMACLVAGTIFRKKWLLALAPIAGYGPAWYSHFFIEGNKPASFKHPLWSLKADLVMWQKIVAGTMDAEVERICGTRARVATDGKPNADVVEHAAKSAPPAEVTVQA
jgi:hypothetical protein